MFVATASAVLSVTIVDKDPVPFAEVFEFAPVRVVRVTRLFNRMNMLPLEGSNAMSRQAVDEAGGLLMIMP